MNVLRPLPVEEFLKLATSAGLEVDREDLEQLERRKLLLPFESGSLGRLHLYLLAVYFDAIRVYRHPWAMKTSSRTLEEVKQIAARIADVSDLLASGVVEQESAELVSQLTLEIERYLASLDPFGPIADVFDVLRADVLDRLRGHGRLYGELHITANALASALEDVAPRLEADGPHTMEIPEEHTTQNLGEDFSDLAEEIEEEVVAGAFDLDRHEIAEADAPTGELPEDIPDAIDEDDARITTETDAAPLEDEDEDEEDAAEHEAVEAAEPETTPAQAEPIPSGEFSRDESTTGRTRALLERLEEIKAQRGTADDAPVEDAPTEDEQIEQIEQVDETGDEQRPATLQEKVNELNLLREQLIRAQDWTGLVDLYEQRIDLFEDPADRQQVLLTLATLYELKLKDQQNAFRCFHEAFEIDDEAGQQKTLDSLRKIGRRSEVTRAWATWLEEHLDAASAPLRSTMQRDLANAYVALDVPARAFGTYAQFLAQNPDAYIDAAALDFLDELSLGVDDDELAGFYDGVLDQDAEPPVRFLLALRAGMFFLGRNEPHHALRCFRIAFEADASSDIAFSNLSRLYEKEENWGDLRAIIARKLTTAEGEEADRLRRELGRVVENEISPEEAIARFSHELEKDPNDGHSLDRLIDAYGSVDRFADAYAHLNRLIDRSLSTEQEVRARKQLASIANEQLLAPEEAAHHFQRALELSGPDREILEGLANVRLSAGEWSDAIATLRVLTGGDVSLASDRLKKWLNAGIEASRQADRPDDLRHFQQQLDGSSSNAS